MLLRVEGLGRFSPHQMIELIRRVAPYLMAGAQAEALETSLEQIEPILASATRTGKAGAKLLLGELTAV